MHGVTLIHIAGGSAALIVGAIALACRKGGRPHVQFGTIFAAAMLVMAGTGSLIAALLPERGTATVGIFTMYLVATSWRTARRKDGGSGLFERLAFAVALLCAAAFLSIAILGAREPDGRLDLLPAASHLPFAAVAALAAGLDLNYMLRRRISGSQRLARHLWRMCMALLIAAFSFFIGQQKVLPEFIQGSPLLYVPPLAVAGAMSFWLVRLRFAKPFRRTVKLVGQPAA